MCSVLVIEDDLDISQNLERLFKSQGYSVKLTENGQVALDYLNAQIELPHVILLDLMMPVMDGFKFREIQKSIARLAEIPVVILSADSQVEDKRKTLMALAAIPKSADISTILTAIKLVC